MDYPVSETMGAVEASSVQSEDEEVEDVGEELEGFGEQEVPEDNSYGEESPKPDDEVEKGETSNDNDDSEEALARAWLNIIDVSSGDEEEEEAAESSWFKSGKVVKHEPEEADDEPSDGEGYEPENEYGDTYECPIAGCGEAFLSEFDANLHSMVHYNDQPEYTCEECGEVFTTSSELEEHERTHPDLMEKCGNCDEEVPKRLMQEHWKQHEKQHKCPSCDTAFTRPHQLKVHMQKCLGSGDGPASDLQQDCQICGSAVVVSLMLKHLKEHALEEVESWGHAEGEAVICKHCQRTFDGKYKALNHLLSHYLPNRTYECSICCYPSSSQRLSEWHTRHVCAQERKDFMKGDSEGKGIKRKRGVSSKPSSGMERVRCDLCNKLLKKGSITNHKAIVHKEVVEVYKCRLCDKVYYSKPNLKFHVDTVHRMKKPVFPCGTCRKLFSSPEERTEHSRLVHTPKRIRCTICDVEMVYYSAKCHYLRHAWEMLGMNEATSDTFGFFPCSMCDRTFSYAQHVVNHIVNHFQPQRIFECDKCFLALSTQSLLAKHKVACNGFAAESDMKRSWKKIGVRVPTNKRIGQHSQVEDTYSVQLHKWQCEKCEKLFDTEEECEEHIRATHENEEDTVEAGGNIFFVCAAE